MTTPTFEPVELPSRYAKAFVAIAAAGLAVLVTALTDNVVTLVEVLGIAVALLTAVSVYLVPNLDAGASRYTKFGVAVLGTGLQAAVPLIVDGRFPASAWLLVLLAALGAVSVGITPNAPSADQQRAGDLAFVREADRMRAASSAGVATDVPSPPYDEGGFVPPRD